MKLTLMLAVLAVSLPLTLCQWNASEIAITHVSPMLVRIGTYPEFKCIFKADTRKKFKASWLRITEHGENSLSYCKNRWKRCKIFDRYPIIPMSYKRYRQYKNRFGRMIIRFGNWEFIDGKNLTCQLKRDHKVLASDTRRVNFYKIPEKVELGSEHTSVVTDTNGRNVRIERNLYCTVAFVYTLPKAVQLVSQATGRVVSTAQNHFNHMYKHHIKSTYVVGHRLSFTVDHYNYNDTFRCEVVMGVDIGSETITSSNVVGPFDIPRDLEVLQYAGPTMVEVGTEVSLTFTFIPNLRYMIRWSTSEETGHDLESKSRLALISKLPNGKDLRRFYERENPTPSFAGRFDVQGTDLSRGRAALHIYNVKLTDQRVFICELLQDKVVIYSKNIFLSVYKKPDHVYVHSNEMVLSPSSQLQSLETVTCTAYGVYPKPQNMELISKITGDVLQSYRYAERVHTNRDGTFDVTYSFQFPLTASQHGEYYECRVNIAYDTHKRIVATSENTTNTIYVNHPTTWAILTISENPVEAGRTVTLTCQSNGYPLNNFEILHVDSGYVFVSSNDTSTAKIWRKVDSTGRGGRYICVANGIQSTTLNFIVNYDDDDD